MNTNYIVKNNKIYEVVGEKEAVIINIVDGIPKKGKETIEYDSANDFAYAFFEIKAKYSYLFENSEKIEEKVEEPKEVKSNQSKKKSEKSSEEE